MKSLVLSFYTLILAFFIAIFFSCIDDEASVGKKWVESSFINVVVDTCTVSLSTVLSDSIVTSGDTLCQIGYRDDEWWGKLNSSFYAEYEVPEHDDFLEGRKYVYDSITIRMYRSGNYMGDTVAMQKINIHKLTKNVEMDNDGYLYNISSTSYEETPMASFNYLPTPNRIEDELEIRLPDTWGEEWFNLMQDGAHQMRNQEFFRDYFKGLAFIPEQTDASCITGFLVNDSSFCIKVYYHEEREIPYLQELVFTPSTTLNFRKVSQDRTGTPLEGLQRGSGYTYQSYKSDNQAYIQGLTGLYVSIDFPYLNNLNGWGELVTIEKAVLQLYPAKGSYDGKYQLPESLTLYTVDQDDVIQSVVYNLTGTSIQTGDLVIDDVYYTDTYYSFDLTSFLQTNLGLAGIYRQKLQVFPGSNIFYTTLGGVVFGDSEHPGSQGKTSRTKLTIAYKVYKN